MTKWEWNRKRNQNLRYGRGFNNNSTRRLDQNEDVDVFGHPIPKPKPKKRRRKSNLNLQQTTKHHDFDNNINKSLQIVTTKYHHHHRNHESGRCVGILASCFPRLTRVGGSQGCSSTSDLKCFVRMTRNDSVVRERHRRKRTTVRCGILLSDEDENDETTQLRYSIVEKCPRTRHELDRCTPKSVKKLYEADSSDGTRFGTFRRIAVWISGTSTSIKQRLKRLMKDDVSKPTRASTMASSVLRFVERNRKRKLRKRRSKRKIFLQQQHHHPTAARDNTKNLLPRGRGQSRPGRFDDEKVSFSSDEDDNDDDDEEDESMKVATSEQDETEHDTEREATRDNGVSMFIGRGRQGTKLHADRCIGTNTGKWAEVVCLKSSKVSYQQDQEDDAFNDYSLQ